jgi:hypothetical protein
VPRTSTSEDQKLAICDRLAPNRQAGWEIPVGIGCLQEYTACSEGGENDLYVSKSARADSIGGLLRAPEPLHGAQIVTNPFVGGTLITRTETSHARGPINTFRSQPRQPHRKEELPRWQLVHLTVV